DTNPATTTVPAGLNGSGPALKRFVEANITITPSAVNPVNGLHTFTVTVMENDGINAGQDITGDGIADGDGATGFAPAPNGTPVTVTLAGTNGAVPVPAGPISGTTTGGIFTVTFTSATAGLVTGNASTTVNFPRFSTEQGFPA